MIVVESSNSLFNYRHLLKAYCLQNHYMVSKSKLVLAELTVWYTIGHKGLDQTSIN